MSTTVNFQDQISIIVPSAIRSLTVAVPVPPTIQSFGYAQTIGSVTVDSTRTPDSTHYETDNEGNKYDVDIFKNPVPGSITFTINVTSVKIAIDLQTPLPSTPLALTNVPPDVAEYLKPTDLVQSTNPDIISEAHALMDGTTDEATLATRIEDFMQRTITYDVSSDNEPDDAAYVLQHKSSLCDGWAHLFLALARADDLPARFVGGYNIGGDIAYPVDSQGRSTLTVTSPGEAHSWVEVWFPTVGWVPFEPQASAGFVDSHHLESWVGTDSDSVESTVSWTSSQAGGQDIAISEYQNPTQMSDEVNVSYCESQSGSANYTVLARRWGTIGSNPQ